MHIYVLAVMEYPAKLRSFEANGLRAKVGDVAKFGYKCRTLR